MNIGIEESVYVIEPVEIPVPEAQPAEPEPVHEPAAPPEREHVPA